MSGSCSLCPSVPLYTCLVVLNDSRFSVVRDHRLDVRGPPHVGYEAPRIPPECREDGSWAAHFLFAYTNQKLAFNPRVRFATLFVLFAWRWRHRVSCVVGVATLLASGRNEKGTSSCTVEVRYVAVARGIMGRGVKSLFFVLSTSSTFGSCDSTIKHSGWCGASAFWCKLANVTYWYIVRLSGVVSACTSWVSRLRESCSAPSTTLTGALGVSVSGLVPDALRRLEVRGY